MAIQCSFLLFEQIWTSSREYASGERRSTNNPSAAETSPLLFPQRVRAEHLHVVRSLERRGLGHVTLTHAALHLLDGFVFVFLHPGPQIRENIAEMTDSMLVEHGSHPRRARDCHHRFESVARRVNASRDRHFGFDVSEKSRRPVQTQTQLIR